ncbi:MAG: Ryanodine receptor Ryr [Lachnospiraceae bacterium]|nr:Ryanodine receptor Ryr [Lachnospiraceae bacterium]
MKETYHPTPIDTNQIELTAEIKEIVERLAENVHDNWAKERIEDGWTYGQMRDDTLKQNPCLVPYDELEESEKKYDRKIVEEVIKTLVAFGYQIS